MQLSKHIWRSNIILATKIIPLAADSRVIPRARECSLPGDELKIVVCVARREDSYAPGRGMHMMTMVVVVVVVLTPLTWATSFKILPPS